jgi:hypothetical protein
VGEVAVLSSPAGMQQGLWSWVPAVQHLLCLHGCDSLCRHLQTVLCMRLGCCWLQDQVRDMQAVPGQEQGWCQERAEAASPSPQDL